MPHDCKGRLIEPGDVIKAQRWNGEKNVPAIGPVVEINESASCSGQFLQPRLGGFAQHYFDACRSEVLLKADGSEPEAPRTPENS